MIKQKIGILWGALLLSMSISVNAKTALLDGLYGLQNSKGSFVQRVLNSDGQLLETSDGNFVFGEGGAFRWGYASGSEQIIIADGDSVWIIDAALEQVVVKPQKDGIGRRPADILVQPELLEELFEVDEVSIGNGYSAELRPKDATGAGYEWLKIAGDNIQVRRLEVRDALGNSTEIQFGDIEKSQPEDKVFSPQLDEGFDIVDERL